MHKSNKLKVSLLLIGTVDNKYKKLLDQQIKHYNLENYVTFTGNKPHPFSLVGKNDIFIQTSLSESIGRTTVEAMKLGLIVIGADIAGTKEAFSLGGGTVYKSQNPADLAEKINMVLSNFDKYQDKAYLAQKNVLANLSEDKCHNNFFKEIKNVFGQQNPQNHLRHLLPHISDNTLQYEKEIRMYKTQIKNYKYHLNNILDSNSCKLIVKTKRLFRK